MNMFKDMDPLGMNYCKMIFTGILPTGALCTWYGTGLVEATEE